MKRKSAIIIASIIALVFLIPTVIFAQEEKEKEVEKKTEKRIKIVTVNEEGEKTVIDTTIAGDEDLEGAMQWIMKDDVDIKTFKTMDGNVFILSGDDEKAFSIYSKADNKVVDEEGKVFLVKKGDKGSFSIVTHDEESEDGHKKISIHVDEDVVHTKDGKVIMKSSKGEGHAYIMKVSEEGHENISWVEHDSKLKEGQVHIVIHSSNEVEDFVIDGDAVITIKDGKVEIDADGMKMNIKKESDLKEVKEKKKEIKKK